MSGLRILRQPVVSERTGDPRSTLYAKIARKKFTPPVRLGPRSSGWPEHEVDALIRARIAGKSDTEILALVQELIAQRGMA